MTGEGKTGSLEGGGQMCVPYHIFFTGLEGCCWTRPHKIVLNAYHNSVAFLVQANSPLDVDTPSAAVICLAHVLHLVFV